MPIYSIQGPDGTIYEIEGPEGATKAQVVAAVQAKMRAPEPAAQRVAVTPPPSTERTTGEAVKDIGASVVGGLGSLLQVPGQLAQLVPGLQGVGQFIAKPGELLEKKGEGLKSQGLKVREALRSQAISEAEKEGILSSFATAITETIKDPALLSTFISGQLPQLLGPAAAAKIAKTVVLSRSGLEGAELASQVGKIATRSAIGAGAAMQGADISSDTYKQAFEAAKAQGMSDEAANDAALTASRKAFALAAPISVATQMLPGGSAIERRLAGVAGTGRLKSAIGEAVSEGIEEGGGAFATNVGVLGVDPTRSLTQGVGAAAGLGTIGGGILGGVLGKAPAPELLPGQRRGESDMDFANRLSQEISNDRAYAAALQAQPEAPPAGPPSVMELADIASKPQGYENLETIKQQILQAGTQKENQETLAAIKDFQNGIVVGEIQRRQPSISPVMDDKTLRSLGFVPGGEKSVYNQLINQDTGSDEVRVFLTDYAQKKAKPQTKQRIEKFLAQVERSQIPLAQGATDAGAAITEPSGAGVQVAVQPGARAPAEGLRTTEPAGVVPPVADVKPPAGGAEAAPPAVAPVEPVKPVETPKTETEAKEQHAVEGLPIVYPPLDQLTLSKDVPQFKSDADEKGVVEKLGGTFDTTGVAPIQVWRRTDGRMEVISGRHRLDLAQRSGEATIPAQIHDEAQGFDAKRAAMLDAELNIRDQQGKVKDYVNYFENAGISQADADARGLLARPPGRQGFAIATQGSPDLIASHRANVVNDAEAFGIASAAPGDARLQALGIKAVSDGKNVNGAVNMMKAVKALAAERGVTEDAGDLFGFDDSAMREAEEMAKIASRKQSEVANRLSAISGASKRPEVAKKEGIDIKDPEALKRREKELRQQKASWDNWSSSPELIQEIKAEMVKPSLADIPATRWGEIERRAKAAQAAPAKSEAAPEKAELTPEQDALNKEIEAKIDQLEKVLKKIMNKFGLKDVALKLIDNMKAEGEYAQSVVRLALDAVNPVQALRHESIHALKELGFFSPQQWAALEKQAKSKWIDQYLKTKNINKEDLEEGQKSRYDAYFQLFEQEAARKGLKGDEAAAYIETATIEEAIADAFGDFDVNKAPPGLMQAILNRLRNFFDAVKTAFGGEVTAEQVFRKVEKGALKAEAKAEAVPAKQSLRPEAAKWTDEQIDEAVANGFSPVMARELRGQQSLFADLSQPVISSIGSYWKTSVSLESAVEAGSTRAQIAPLKAAETRAFKQARNALIQAKPELAGDPAKLNPYLANPGKDLGDYLDEAKPSLRELNPELKALGITEKALQQFLKYKAAERRVGSDPLYAKPADKAASTRAFRAFMEEMGGVDSTKARVALNKIDIAYMRRGEEGLFTPQEDLFGPEAKPSLRDKLGMYSELETKIEAGSNKAPAASWKAYINGLTQKGVKPEEIEWSGVRDWLDLQKGTVTKEDLLNYLKQGGVKVEEVVLSKSTPQEDETDFDTGRYDEFDGTKYGKYTLPGGENYREVLLTLPDKNADRLHQLDIKLAGGNATLEERKEYYALLDSNLGKGAYRSNHWETTNVLAHIRVNDRTDADGSKVLFVEEIQSDWGQEGKKKGFAGPQALVREGESGGYEVVYPDGQVSGEYPTRRTAEEAARRNTVQGVPLAPFVTKTEGWLNLALKRIMVMAAEGGYDKVAFVNGGQSADRYDLSKQVRQIDWGSDRDGSKSVSIEPLSGNTIEFRVQPDGTTASMSGGESGNEFTGKRLDEVVGKEVADKIMAGRDGTLRGNGLKVGGEGMKTFYNTIVPTALKKLLPKVGGGQVEIVEMFAKGRDVGEVVDANGEVVSFGATREIYEDEWGSDYTFRSTETDANLAQPGFDVTDAMREKVQTTGLPRFSLRVNIPASARARVVATTVTRQEKGFVERLMEAISPTSYSDFRAQALNRYNQLGVYDKIRAKKMGGAALLADQSAESAALLSDVAAGLVASALGVHDRMGGIPVFRNGITIISNQNGTIKAPVAIFAPLAADPSHYQAYQYWAGVQRGSRFLADGREHLFNDPNDQREAEKIRKAFLKEKIDFIAIQKEWIKYNNGLVQYMVDTGVLSKEKADLFRKHGDYMPFYRQMDGRETIGPKVFQAISGVKPPKKLKGGEAPLDDFLESIVRNTQSAIQAGVKNVAGQRAAKVAMDIGMASRLNFKSSAPGTFDVLENGQVVTYQSKDELFINAIKSLGIPDLPFIGLLSGPANLLRNLVTKDPGFMLANLMRDSMSAWVTSGVKMTPMVNTFTNFGAAIAGKDPAFQALMNAGILGGYEFSQNVEQSGREFGKALRKQAKIKSTGLKGAAEMGAKPFTSLWDALEKGSTASDAATRMEVYKRTLAETGNEAEALFRALEVMNFNRKGSSAVVRILTAAVPFLNARMQGLDVLYRAASGQMNARDAAQIQKQFFVRGAMMASLSAAYWLLTHDDEEYKKQEQETRDNYWLLPSLGVKIPIPFEIGVLFKVIPERILGYTFGSDTGEDFLKSMARQLTSTLAFNPIPQAVMPVVETMTNFSFFTMRPIVGQGLEGLQPAYQVGPGTSRLAEGLGEMTKGMAKELQVSPMKIDQLISGYTGTMGMYLMNLMDAVYDMNTDSPKPARRFEQMPLIRRFAVDPEARGNVTAYYELKNSVDSIVRTSNMLERTMNYEELPGYLMDNMRMLASKDYILDLEKTMKEFREMKILIRSASMDADAKKEAILAIDQMENQLTSNIQYMKKLAKGD